MNLHVGKASAHFTKRSIRSGSWFADTNMPISKILLLTLYIAIKRDTKDIKKDLGVSPSTLADWRQFFREVCSEVSVYIDGKIGGEGKIVEIYQLKFGKRKHNTGKHVDGVWVCLVESKGVVVKPFSGLLNEEIRALF